MSVPAEFDDNFIDWFKVRTEASWNQHAPLPLEQYERSRVGGFDWQLGTRWKPGLTEKQLLHIESRFSLRFPPDYRLFLARLHCVDRPLVGAAFSDDRGSSLIPQEKQSFTDWLSEENPITRSRSQIIEGLEFDVEHNDLWFENWGAKPAKGSELRARLYELVTSAPKLVPICGHRFLLAEPANEGNPVLSIYQSDLVIYSTNLRSFFLTEFASLLGITTESSNSSVFSERAIPFWGEFLD